MIVRKGGSHGGKWRLGNLMLHGRKGTNSLWVLFSWSWNLKTCFWNFSASEKKNSLCHKEVSKDQGEREILKSPDEARWRPYEFWKQPSLQLEYLSFPSIPHSTSQALTISKILLKFERVTFHWIFLNQWSSQMSSITIPWTKKLGSHPTHCEVHRYMVYKLSRWSQCTTNYESQ